MARSVLGNLNLNIENPYHGRREFFFNSEEQIMELMANDLVQGDVVIADNPEGVEHLSQTISNGTAFVYDGNGVFMSNEDNLVVDFAEQYQEIDSFTIENGGGLLLNDVGEIGLGQDVVAYKEDIEAVETTVEELEDSMEDFLRSKVA